MNKLKQDLELCNNSNVIINNQLTETIKRDEDQETLLKSVQDEAKDLKLDLEIFKMKAKQIQIKLKKKH